VVIVPVPPPALVPGPDVVVEVVVDMLVPVEPADPVVRPPSPPSGGPPKSTVLPPQAAATRRKSMDCAVVKDFMVRSSAS
jgi:hypothetical protein